MDEENSDTPRVTRARTRRMSALESDRPLTPQVDLVAERPAAASPRVMRRTRVNSSTIELRTPIRATRSLLARGDTPEPATPTLSLSAAKRATRTPAKSARKQLTLQEDLKEEEAEAKQASIEVAVDPITPVQKGAAGAISTPPSDDRRVTRSMSKTPPVAGRSANNTPTNVKNSPKAKPKETQQKPVTPKIVDVQKIHSDEKVAEKSISKFQTKQAPVEEAEMDERLANVSMSMVATTSKVKVNVKDILLDYKSPIAPKETNKTNPQDEENNGMEKAKEQLMPSTEATEVLLDDLDVALVCDALVIDDVRLPDLTPKLMSRVVEQKSSESRKAVGFNGDNQVEDDTKTKYPKTPARITNLSVKKGSMLKVKHETPLKPLLKERKSSTPLAKSETPLQDEQTVASDEPRKQPPAQIDVIPPFSALEDDNNNNKSTEVEITKETLASRLDSDDEDEEADRSASLHNEDEYEDAEEDEDNRSACEFFDTEAEVFENYESGDSMDSAERREIKENEILYDGESVGSQDTPDEHSEDEEEGSADERMSFIVSDSDGEGDGDGCSITSLCFSSAEEDAEDAKLQKKYRRIVSIDSSDEEKPGDTVAKENEVKNDENAEEKPMEKKEKETAELPEKSLKPTESEEAVQLDKSIAINKTVSSVGHSDEEPMEIDEVSSSSDDEDGGNESKLNNKSIYEVLDSCGDDDGDESSVKVGAKDNVDDVGKSLKSSAEHENEQASSSNGKDNDEIPILSSKQSEQSSTETVAGCKSVATASESSTFHDKQKRGEEEVLLAELASCDVSHLQKMFNPLQKSRRQTLYMEDTPMPAKEPKLKRRSVQLNSDVQPSQSFIETLAEEQRRLSKRKRMSKSFCGAADNLDVSVVEEVQRKKAKRSCDNAEAEKVEAERSADQLEKVLTATDQLEVELPVTQMEVELPVAKIEKELPDVQKEQELPVAQKEKNLLPVVNNVEKVLSSAKVEKELPARKVEKELPAGKVEMKLPASKVEMKLPAAQKEDAQIEEQTHLVCVEQLPVAKLELQLPAAAPKEPAKRRSFYLDYCDNILLAANEAKLQQKKQQRLAAGDQQVKQKRPSKVVTDPLPNSQIAILRASPERELSAKIKKNVKRLQATKQAVKQAVNHAVQLLVPDAAANKQPQSLARKLSPQPEVNGRTTKQTKAKANKKKKRKGLVEQVTPGNSSEEEELIKTRAGWVFVTKEQQEIVKTNSGPMIVEPCTPKQKHFRVDHLTPVGLGFQEQQLPHRTKAKDKRNAATEAALRFKMKMFGRDK
ncbi:protein slender lobes isoform X2 [Drosophila grimshawi]|uniref:GH19126 n=1 Tax=Drosophila grimshawi TaxID=7222 RepID=B4JIM8_DROGR|nr:protein slender lobes isoform X2 [Drosophila grimshawi]EDV93109.1 GH19126 [Drosophila grimshawi]